MGFDAMMMVLAQDASNHIDHTVMTIFWTTARNTFDNLSNRSEGECRRLLEQPVLCNFGME